MDIEILKRIEEPAGKKVLILLKETGKDIQGHFLRFHPTKPSEPATIEITDRLYGCWYVEIREIQAIAFGEGE